MKTTPEQFEEFKTEFMRYVELLGLKAWDIDFELKPNKKLDAWLKISDLEERQLTVYISATSINKSPAYLAKHEALHLLLYKLTAIAHERYLAKESIIDEEAHAIIGTLEAIIK